MLTIGILGGTGPQGRGLGRRLALAGHPVLLGSRSPQRAADVAADFVSGLVAAGTVTLIALISYSAMAGAIGGGGLGDFAIRYGYQRFDTAVTLACVVVLLVMVQVLQSAGDRLARRLAHR